MSDDEGGPRRRSRGERRSVAEAFLACERSLKRFIARLCRNEGDVEDYAHEALLNAMKAEEARPIEQPEAYLYRAARNLVIRTHRKKSREIIRDVDEATRAQVVAAEPSVEEHVISRERFALFCEAVATLPPSCRRVFAMRKIYGYSHKEISERLGISTSTVEKHLATGFARCLAFMSAKDADVREQDADRESTSDGYGEADEQI